MVLKLFDLGLWACIFPKLVWPAKECSLWMGDFLEQCLFWVVVVYEKD